MRWFKHFSDARNSEFLKLLKRKYGLEGLARYWLLVEAVSEKMERRDSRCSLEMSIGDWCELLSGKPKRVLPFLYFLVRKTTMLGWVEGVPFPERFGNKPETFQEHNENVLKMKVPKLLKLRDNRNSNKPTVSLQEVEVEVEKEILKKKPAKPKKKTKAKPTPLPSELEDLYENSSSVPENFEAWAKKKGIVVEIRPIFEDFCRNHLKRGSEWADWYRTWQTWIANAKEMNPEYFVKKASKNSKRDQFYNEFVRGYLGSPGEEFGYESLISQLRLHCPDHKPYSLKAIRKRIDG